MYKVERTILFTLVSLLFIIILGTGIACKSGKPDPATEVGTYLTVMTPGANMHTTDDVKSQANLIKGGAIFPGAEVKVIDSKIIAYKVITKATPDKPSRTGWIYAGLVSKITNR